LFAPFYKSSSEASFEVIIKRMQAGSGDTTVAVAFRFALHRYIEDGMEPVLKDELCDVNRWTLRMVDDGEPDEDFPPMERTQPVTKYIEQGRRGGRVRVRAVKLDGEFALVEATPEQCMSPHNRLDQG
jgi:hypothetical protein